jgi:hypothetical protein
MEHMSFECSSCDVGYTQNGNYCNSDSAPVEAAFSCGGGWKQVSPDVEECTENVCQCEFGIGVSDGTCHDEADINCAVCDDGYDMQFVINDDGVHYHKECGQTGYICACDNGVAVASEFCADNGFNDCDSCNVGYRQVCDDVSCECEEVPAGYMRQPGNSRNKGVAELTMEIDGVLQCLGLANFEDGFRGGKLKDLADASLTYVDCDSEMAFQEVWYSGSAKKIYVAGEWLQSKRCISPVGDANDISFGISVCGDATQVFVSRVNSDITKAMAVENRGEEFYLVQYRDQVEVVEE